MSDTVKFTVGRAHWGDKIVDGKVVRHRYQKDETREGEREQFADEIRRGILIAPETAKSKPASDDAKGDAKKA